MKRLLIPCLLWALGAPAQTNTNVSNYVLPDAEPCLAASPADPQLLVAAWMKLTGLTQVSIATAFSADGGQTWSVPSSHPHLVPAFTHADPSLAFNADGSLLYLCYIDFAVSKDTGYVVVARSADHGQTWDPPVVVTAGTESPDLPVDRPWIAVDGTNGPYSGRLYVTSKSVDIGAAPHHVWMKSSADSGQTWSALTLVDDSIPTALVTNSMGVPAVGADGALYVAYASWYLAANLFPQYVAVKSTDGGATFTPYIVATAVAGSGITDSLYQGSYHLAANPADTGNLVFIGTDARYGDPDILAVRSADGGVTWTANPVRVNDDVAGNGAGQDMCWGAFNAAGTYACGWRDRRNGGAGSGAPFELFVSVSGDGGLSFTPNQNLSSAPSPPIALVKGNDFIGIAVTDSAVHADWCDLRTGNMEIFTAGLPLGVVLSSPQAPPPAARGLHVFPNPARGTVYVRPGDPADALVGIELSDLAGRVVRLQAWRRIEGSGSQLIVDVSGLVPGGYLMTGTLASGGIARSALLLVY